MREITYEDIKKSEAPERVSPDMWEFTLRRSVDIYNALRRTFDGIPPQYDNMGVICNAIDKAVVPFIMLSMSGHTIPNKKMAVALFLEMLEGNLYSMIQRQEEQEQARRGNADGI